MRYCRTDPPGQDRGRRGQVYAVFGGQLVDLEGHFQRLVVVAHCSVGGDAAGVLQAFQEGGLHYLVSAGQYQLQFWGILHIGLGVPVAVAGGRVRQVGVADDGAVEVHALALALVENADAPSW